MTDDWQRIAQLSAVTVRDSCAELLSGTIALARKGGLDAVPIPVLLYLVEAIRSLKMPRDIASPPLSAEER